mmetsp:Transcript_26465/g.44244  ORF Transcript_26465/g.44244 Transcript_26465/m.44244 type:complete len:206 (+) Transcript_26465:2659-3276(+)
MRGELIRELHARLGPGQYCHNGERQLLQCSDRLGDRFVRLGQSVVVLDGRAVVDLQTLLHQRGDGRIPGREDASTLVAPLVDLGRQMRSRGEGIHDDHDLVQVSMCTLSIRSGSGRVGSNEGIGARHALTSVASHFPPTGIFPQLCSALLFPRIDVKRHSARHIRLTRQSLWFCRRLFQWLKALINYIFVINHPPFQSPLNTINY